jgi:hypothetical protein
VSVTPATRPLRSRVRRVLVRGVQVLAAVFVLFVVIVVVDGWRAFGSSASGARRERIDRSPQHAGGEFVNPQPMQNHAWKMVTGLFSKSSVASPSAPPPVEAVEAARFASPPESGLRVTWLGHSTIVIELDGHRVLTDPVWSDRISPVSWAGPSRFYPPPLELDDLPRLDAVLLSHDHYDHLDYPTIVALKDTQVRFVTPIGVGAHLEYWGVTADRIDELDWWEEVLVGELRVACTPARHASGRTLFDTSKIRSWLEPFQPRRRGSARASRAACPLHLGDDLLDDVASLLERGADHRHDELERAGAAGDDRGEESMQHLRELDDALGGARRAQHLEDRRPIAHLPVGPAELVARDLHRRLGPLGEGTVLVDGLHQVLADEEPGEAVALRARYCRAFLWWGDSVGKLTSLTRHSPTWASPPCMSCTCALRS